MTLQAPRQTFEWLRQGQPGEPDVAMVESLRRYVDLAAAGVLFLTLHPLPTAGP